MKKLMYILLVLLVARPIAAQQFPQSVELDGRQYSFAEEMNQPLLVQYWDKTDLNYQLRFSAEPQDFSPCIKQFKIACDSGIEMSVCLPSYFHGRMVLSLKDDRNLTYPYLTVSLGANAEFSIPLIRNTCEQAPLLFQQMHAISQMRKQLKNDFR